MGRASLLLGTAIVAGGAFAAVARAVARRDTARIDHEVHQRTTVPQDHPVRRAAEAAPPIGKWWTYLPAAMLTGGYILVSRDGRDDLPSRLFGTAAIVGAATAARALSGLFDDRLPQPPAPPGRPVDHPVFPSGHAFGTTAVALTAAYVLARERIAHGGIVFPLALVVPLVSSLGRMIEEKHWISDVAGAHLAAVTLAAVALAPYEAAARERDAAERES